MSYTWAQGMFLFCAVILAPAAGFFAARQSKGRLGRAILQFLVGTFIVLGALLGGGVLAKMFFPGYPSVPESEWVAISFTLPALAIALFTWKLFPTNASHTDSPAFRRTTALLFLYITGIAVTFTFFAWPYRQRLPWTAHGVRDSAIEELFLGDFAYFMRARVTRDEYLKYVQKYGLKEQAPVTAQVADAAVAWWQPTPGPELSHMRIDENWRMTTDFLEGVMHVKVTLGSSSE